MPNGKILSVTACVLVLAAAAADYGLGQVDVAKPHRLPVETFPASLGANGAWQGGPIQDVDPEVQKKLATAKIVERVYSNKAGEGLDLMLLTATEDEDMHSPKACFPSQGWKLSDVHPVSVDGQPATEMSAAFEGGQRQKVLYWLTGYYPPAPPRSAFLRKAASLRDRVVGPHNNMSLFVRIIAPDSPQGNQALADFTTVLHDPLQRLAGKGLPSASNTLYKPF